MYGRSLHFRILEFPLMWSHEPNVISSWHETVPKWTDTTGPPPWSGVINWTYNSGLKFVGHSECTSIHHRFCLCRIPNPLRLFFMPFDQKKTARAPGVQHWHEKTQCHNSKKFHTITQPSCHGRVQNAASAILRPFLDCKVTDNASFMVKHGQTPNRCCNPLGVPCVLTVCSSN